MNPVRKSGISRVAIVVVAALLVEIISILQYRRVSGIMMDGMDVRSRIVLGSVADRISHVLELTESSVNENMKDLRGSLSSSDKVFDALTYAIDDNPHIVSGCIGFEPGYFKDQGDYFEPAVFKTSGGFVRKQLGSAEHDYRQHPSYKNVVKTRVPDWSEPYPNGGNPDEKIITYSTPLIDDNGVLAGVYGVDIEADWLGDTLNANTHLKSSFRLLLTGDGALVAGPPSSMTSPEEVEEALALIRRGSGSLIQDKKFSIRTFTMPKEPHWQIANVYYMDEIFAPVRKVRLQQIGLVLLGLLILFFMINRFARNEKKLRDASAEQARLGGELEVARRIQQEMLPKTFPDNIFGLLEPAREVGGDLFDFYRRDGKFFFCIGDVSGKGVPSAMLMSMVHSLFRMVSEQEESPSRILSALNRQICRGNDSNMFITFFVGTLDAYTGRFRYSNAGHDKPFLLTDNASLLPAKANLPLGVFPDTTYQEEVVTLSPGTSIFLYTDGLTEAKNPQRKAFGRPRVEEILSAGLKASSSPEEMVKALSDAAHSFAAEAPQSDDLTMLMIHYAPGELLTRNLVLNNDSEALPMLSAFLKEYLGLLNLDQKLSLSLRLAVEETVVNAINYAYPSGKSGTVNVYADSDFKEVRFTVVDKGIPFDPTAVIPASTSLDVKDRNIGGLGILLTRKIMDSVSYCRKEESNVFTLTKNIV